MAPALQVPDPSLVVLAGPAGCGKSTLARRHFAPEDVLSSDQFRGLVAGDPADQSATAAAFGLLGHALDARLRRRRLTVVDATNITRRERRRLVGVADRYDLPSLVIALALPLEVCLERVTRRSDRPVPEDVVTRQHATFLRQLATLEQEGFDDVLVVDDAAWIEALEVVRDTEPGELPARPTHDHGLPPAVLVDLDGTLTSAEWRTHHLRGGRKDWDAFFAGMGRDAPVRPLVELVEWVSTRAEVILLTGRPDDHERVVRRWLADHEVVYDQLLMRRSGDRRPDTVVKRERYREDVAPHHDVRLVLDDRPQVIEMWRDEGLYVLTAVDPHLDPLPERPNHAPR